MTINSLRSSASILKKSTKANSSKQEKNAEVGSSKKAKEKKGMDLMAGLDVEGQKSCDDAHGSPEVHLVDRKRSLVKGSDSEPEFEANFRHWGHKWCETVVPRGDRVNLGMMF